MKKNNFDLIPEELKALPQWVLWRLEEVDGRKTKIPYQINGRKASTNKSLQWCDFQKLKKKFEEEKHTFSGVGFVFSEADPYIGIDFDSKKDKNKNVISPVLNPETGEIIPEIADWINKLNSYTEVSQSGTGIHIIVKGDLPLDKGNKAFLEKFDIEIYKTGRYFALTGDKALDCEEILESNGELSNFYNAFFPQKKSGKTPSNNRNKNDLTTSSQIIEKLSESKKQGEKFKKLFSGDWSADYGSQSEADLAFCSMVAFYTQDFLGIDQIFRKSGLYREKWDREDYKNDTISKAISSLTNTYSPNEKSKGKTKKKEKKESKIESIVNYLKKNFACRKNSVTGKIEFTKIDLGVLREKNTYINMQDHELNTIEMELLHGERLTAVKQDLKTAIFSDFISPKFDPLKDYLDNLRWDGEDYISKLINTIRFKNDNDKLRFSKYFVKWLVATVGTWRSEIVNDMILVFSGGQGIGKTMWLNKLLDGTGLEKYLDVKKDINPDNKDSLIALCEKAIINLDELATLRKVDVESLKSLVSRKEVSIRRPYGVFPEELKRRAAFCGSINDDSFLTDSTGNRRWLVFEVDDLDQFHEIDMNSLWAQVYDLYKKGYAWYLDGDEIKELNETNEQFVSKSVEEELLLQYATTEEAEGFFTTTQLMSELYYRANGNEFAESNGRGKIPDTYSVVRLGKALKKLGFRREKRSGVYGWVVCVIPFGKNFSEENLKKFEGDIPVCPDGKEFFGKQSLRFGDPSVNCLVCGHYGGCRSIDLDSLKNY